MTYLGNATRKCIIYSMILFFISGPDLLQWNVHKYRAQCIVTWIHFNYREENTVIIMAKFKEMKNPLWPFQHAMDYSKLHDTEFLDLMFYIDNLTSGLHGHIRRNYCAIILALEVGEESLSHK